jgi:hypothetical protein
MATDPGMRLLIEEVARLQAEVDAAVVVINGLKETSAAFLTGAQGVVEVIASARSKLAAAVATSPAT